MSNDKNSVALGSNRLVLKHALPLLLEEFNANKPTIVYFSLLFSLLLFPNFNFNFNFNICSFSPSFDRAEYDEDVRSTKGMLRAQPQQHTQQAQENRGGSGGGGGGSGRTGVDDFPPQPHTQVRNISNADLSVPANHS